MRLTPTSAVLAVALFLGAPAAHDIDVAGMDPRGPAPSAGGFTDDQRFFISFGQN
jgi:hypothetical protein